MLLRQKRWFYLRPWATAEEPAAASGRSILNASQLQRQHEIRTGQNLGRNETFIKDVSVCEVKTDTPTFIRCLLAYATRRQFSGIENFQPCSMLIVEYDPEHHAALDKIRDWIRTLHAESGITNDFVERQALSALGPSMKRALIPVWLRPRLPAKNSARYSPSALVDTPNDAGLLLNQL